MLVFEPLEVDDLFEDEPCISKFVLDLHAQAISIRATVTFDLQREQTAPSRYQKARTGRGENRGLVGLCHVLKHPRRTSGQPRAPCFRPPRIPKTGTKPGRACDKRVKSRKHRGERSTATTRPGAPPWQTTSWMWLTVVP